MLFYLLLACNGSISGKAENVITGKAISEEKLVATASSEKESCNRLEGTTKEDGSFKIEGTCKETEYSLVFENKKIILEGKEKYAGGENVEIGAPLKALSFGTFKGKLTNKLNGSPIPNSTVKARAKSDKKRCQEREAKTKDDGSFQLDETCEGLKYSLQFSKTIANEELSFEGGESEAEKPYSLYQIPKEEGVFAALDGKLHPLLPSPVDENNKLTMIGDAASLFPNGTKIVVALSNSSKNWQEESPPSLVELSYSTEESADNKWVLGDNPEPKSEPTVKNDNWTMFVYEAGDKFQAVQLKGSGYVYNFKAGDGSRSRGSCAYIAKAGNSSSKFPLKGLDPVNLKKPFGANNTLCASSHLMLDSTRASKALLNAKEVKSGTVFWGTASVTGEAKEENGQSCFSANLNVPKDSGIKEEIQLCGAKAGAFETLAKANNNGSVKVAGAFEKTSGDNYQVHSVVDSKHLSAYADMAVLSRSYGQSASSSLDEIGAELDLTNLMKDSFELGDIKTINMSLEGLSKDKIADQFRINWTSERGNLSNEYLQKLAKDSMGVSLEESKAATKTWQERRENLYNDLSNFDRTLLFVEDLPSIENDGWFMPTSAKCGKKAPGDTAIERAGNEKDRSKLQKAITSKEFLLPLDLSVDDNSGTSIKLTLTAKGIDYVMSGKPKTRKEANYDCKCCNVLTRRCKKPSRGFFGSLWAGLKEGFTGTPDCDCDDDFEFQKDYVVGYRHFWDTDSFAKKITVKLPSDDISASSLKASAIIKIGKAHRICKEDSDEQTLYTGKVIGIQVESDDTVVYSQGGRKIKLEDIKDKLK